VTNSAPAASRHDVTELSITELARRTGLASSALRFYEEEGILEPTRRTPGGYRMYGSAASDRVLFIRMAQEAGLTLDDVRAVLEPRGSSASCAAIRTIVKRRLGQVRERIAALRRFEKALAAGLRCRPKHVSELCARLCAAAGSACAPTDDPRCCEDTDSKRRSSR
jgi:DNA-binding transcriptional MerR regulator